ncbi:MAG TPA: DUF711 family protein [Ktedonobacterales bacterium]|jgi:uncharacterized protein (UPF0210 family)|nr:DUF711 family protein [Ktedonobacterales bacterium]
MTTIRAITVFIGDAHPLDSAALARAAAFLRHAQASAEAQGYVVQTTRIATRPLLEDLTGWNDDELIAYADDLQNGCEMEQIEYLSLGPAPAWDPAFALDRLPLLVELLAPRPALNATAQIAWGEHAPRYPAALAIARVMRGLAEASAGDANFRFALLAMCEPGGPFFPQAYTRGPEWSVAFGLQSAGVVGEAIASTQPEDEERADGLATLSQIEQAVREALAGAARPVATLLRGLAEEASLTYGGVDLSPAPMGDESIAAAMEQAGLGLFGEPGTLALAATLTAAIRGAASDLADVTPPCGYCGLMLPVLEDETLGMRAAEGMLTVSSLLSYSAVCGTGLDTTPLPGDAPLPAVAALLADVSALAWRLRKPLSARLFLTPGAQAGDMTNFASPYLTNTRVLPL